MFNFEEKYFSEIRWECWVSEVKKWEKCVFDIFPNHYNQNRSRAKGDAWIDLFNEYKAIYFFSEILGFDILEIEPRGGNNRRLDFSFFGNIGKQKEKWLVEVKTPSWKSEITGNNNDFQKYNSQEKEIIKNRLRESKYKSGEGKSVDPKDAIKYPIKKSIKQFQRDNNNLLVITRDTFISPLVLPPSHLIEYTKELIKKYDKNNLISAVCILEGEILGMDNSKISWNKEILIF